MKFLLFLCAKPIFFLKHNDVVNIDPPSGGAVPNVSGTPDGLRLAYAVLRCDFVYSGLQKQYNSRRNRSVMNLCKKPEGTLHQENFLLVFYIFKEKELFGHLFK